MTREYVGKNRDGVELYIGDRVVLNGGEDLEYGVIVSSFRCGVTGAVDCYIAFFHDSESFGSTGQKPYVLRYFASTLVKWEREESK